jgi:hypothetical protein
MWRDIIHNSMEREKEKKEKANNFSWMACEQRRARAALPENKKEFI